MFYQGYSSELFSTNERPNCIVVKPPVAQNAQRADKFLPNNDLQVHNG